jgi:hypothetical protein
MKEVTVRTVRIGVVCCFLTSAAVLGLLAAYVPGWQNLGGTLSLEGPAVASPAPNLLYLFVRNGNQVAYQRIDTNAQKSGTWVTTSGSPAGGIVGAPAAVYIGVGAIAVVVRNGNGNLRLRTFDASNNTWLAGWEQVGADDGVTTADPGISAAPGLNRRMDVWIRSGRDNAVSHTWRTDVNVWAGWDSFGLPPGGAVSAPAVVARQQSPLLLDMVVRAADNALWYQRFDEGVGPSGWSSLGGVTTFAPAITAQSASRVDVFARGAGGGGSGELVYHKYLVEGTDWSAYDNAFGAPGNTISRPAAIWRGTMASDGLNVVIQRNDGAYFLRTWYDIADTPSLGTNRAFVPNATWENTAIAVPPDTASCGPSGGVIVSRGNFLDGTNRAWVNRNRLTCYTDGTACQSEDIAFAPHQGNPSPPTPSQFKDFFQGAPGTAETTSDNDIARLKNGSIILARMAVRYNGISATLYDQSSRRGMVIFHRSTDCGTTWSEASSLDPDPWSGNFDQGYLYFHPPYTSGVNGRLYYVVTDVPRPVGVRSVVGALFGSADNGTTWTKAPNLPSLDGALQFGLHYVMTGSASSDRLYVFGCTTNGPTARVYRPDTNALGAAFTIPNARCDTVIKNDFTISNRRNIQEFGEGVAWVGIYHSAEYFLVSWRDTELVTENGVQVKRQVLRSTALKRPYGTDTVQMGESPIHTLRASASSGSILQATLIENDRIDASPVTNVQSNVALLYWLETSSSPTSATTVTARAQVIRDIDQWSSPIDLTRATRFWSGFSSTGDYYRGGFWRGGGASNGNSNFLPLWVESTASGSQLHSTPVAIGVSTPINVTVINPFNDASVDAVTSPGSLPSGTSGTVSVTLRNTGDTPWTPGQYLLRLTRTNRVSLPANTAALTGTVPAGGTVTLTFTVTCASPGTGGFSVQMGGPNGAFGTSTGRTIVCQ